MNKEEIINKIQEDLKNNNKIWVKNIKRKNIFTRLIIIFLILAIAFSFFLSFYPGGQVNIGFLLAVPIAPMICFFLFARYTNKSDECMIKEIYLKKALWIVEYWLTPTLELDQSFLKYNYPTEENRSAVDYVLNHIDMEIKEKK